MATKKKPRTVVDEQWWLMWAAFPDLNWARLRVFDDGKADVLDCDGRRRTFQGEAQARVSLLEDEYTRLSELSDEDDPDLPVPRRELHPPVANSDRELVPKMRVRSRR